MSHVALALAASSCASTQAARVGPSAPPKDVATLRAEVGKEERAIAETTRAYPDPALRAYLERVAARVAGPGESGAAPPIRVVVILDPRVNAFALPDGPVYVHTGLLARLDSEPQLAAVLAHELAHATERHALRVGRPAGGAIAGVFGGRDLPLALQAAVTGYGRDLEREADALGIARLAAAGYEARQAAAAYHRLEPERGEPVELEVFALGNPSRLEERAAAARELLRDRAGAAESGAAEASGEDFARRTRGAVRENALLDLRAGRFERARAQLERIEASAPNDPATQLALGDLFRLEAQRAGRPEGERALLDRARGAYERALALDPAYPEAFRQLGLLYYQARDNERAREAFGKYLALRPDAPDAARIREYVSTLEQ